VWVKTILTAFIADEETMLILDADDGYPLSVKVSLTTNGVTETFEEL